MPTRRTLLTGAAALSALGGCLDGESLSRVVTPSPTPTETPASTPAIPDQVEAALLKDWQFPVEVACPAAVTCIHRLSIGDDPDAVIVPEVESIDSSTPSATLTTYNLRAEPLVLESEPVISTWTGHTWVPVVPIHHDRDRTDDPDAIELQLHETVDRTVGTDVGRDGRYAVVERGRYGGDGDGVAFGALVDLEDSTWTFDVDPVPTERDGDTVVVDPDGDGDRTLLFERADRRYGIGLVTETLAAHPKTATAMLALAEDGVERVTVTTDGTVVRYLEAARVRPVAITPDRALRFREVVFYVSVE